MRVTKNNNSRAQHAHTYNKGPITSNDLLQAPYEPKKFSGRGPIISNVQLFEKGLVVFRERQIRVFVSSEHAQRLVAIGPNKLSTSSHCVVRERLRKQVHLVELGAGASVGEGDSTK